jgi:hypothetical protein
MSATKKSTQGKTKGRKPQKIKVNNPESTSEVVTKVKDPMSEIQATRKPVQSEQRDSWGAIGLEKISVVLSDVLEKKPTWKHSDKRKKKTLFKRKGRHGEKKKPINERLNEDMKSLYDDINQLISDIELVSVDDIDWDHLNKNQNAFKAIAEMVFDDDPQGKDHPAYEHYLRLIKNLGDE